MKTITLLFLLILPAAVPAAVKPHALFSDGAVLQCDLPVPVWGTAKADEKVTVIFAGQTVSTTADSKGDWQVKLKPLKANAEPQTMTIAGENTVTISNLLVGEVWVCSGQSNMQWTLSGTANSAEAIAAANDPQIRLFTVQRFGYGQPLRELKNASWSECNSKTVPGFSAVAYYFGRDLRKAVKRPVGLISSNVGGTPAESWTSRASFEAVPELRSHIAAHAKAIADYPAVLAKYQTNEPALLVQYDADVTAAKAAGKPAPRKPTPPGSPANSGPSNLYNAMIAPLQPFAIRGVIWYQGESNAGRAEQYKTLFPALIRGWREAWGQGEFPFLFVQIAPYKQMPPEIREAQLISWQKTPNTAMAVITDCGDAGNIHPTRKEPVGARLALAARALAYGEKLEYSGPVIDKIKLDGDKAILTFTHVGGGLMAKDGELKGFTIFGSDKKFAPAEAKIEGQTVVVTATNISQALAVAYGWANVPDVNLFNKEGLPATPFRIQVPK